MHSPPSFSHHEWRPTMTTALAVVVVGCGLLASSTALAAEKTITLAVKNMYCAACPHTVKASLEAVPGVAKAVVSYKDQTAIVTYDDTKTDVKALTTTGSIGAVLAALCCFTPLLAVALGAVGLTAWLAKADYVLLPVLLLCLA